jgi:hypothetical protein
MYKNVELSPRARSLQEFGCDVSLRDKEVVDTLWPRVAFQVFACQPIWRMQCNLRSTSRDDACCGHYPLRPIIGSGWKGNGRIERIQGDLFSWNLIMLLTPPCYAGNHASNLLHEPDDQYPA